MINFKQMFSLLERIDPQYRQYKQLINEADSRLIQVNRIIDQVFSNYFNPDDTVRSSEYYVNDNPNTTWRQYLLFNLRHAFGLMQNSDVKYLPLVARLAYSNDVRFDISNDNGEEINTLRRIVNLLKKDANLFNEVKNNPNITFGQLAEKFKESFAQEDAADADAANSVQNVNTQYTVKEVPDFRTAKYYGDRSCSSSKLCYTQGKNTWDSFTKNGMNRVYVCLRNGWENIPEEATEGNPYDLYGTSMIFVFINPMGNLVTSNCRWNHHTVGNYNGDVDHAFTKTTLSQTIGIPFDSVFKPKENFDANGYISRLIMDGNSYELRNIAVGDFVIPDGITTIRNFAFRNCTELISITIPNSVTSIGGHAFYDCTSLESITIPNSVTSIGASAFNGCTSLTSVTINSSSIVSANYDYNNNLNKIFGTQVTEYIIGNGVTTIGKYAFTGCIGLKSITIPDSVTTIGEGALSGCISLTSINIPSSVTSIGDRAFQGCVIFTKNFINNSSLDEIKNNYWDAKIADRAINDTYFRGNILIAYKGNNSIIDIPSNVTTIGEGAFGANNNITEVRIPNSVTEIGRFCFITCKNLTNVTLPNNITKINALTFGICESLTNITIPDSVTYIDEGAFMSCSSLTTAVMSNSIVKIGKNAFAFCKSLTNITLPNSVTYIDEGAFNFCNNLTVYVQSEQTANLVKQSGFEGNIEYVR